MKSFLEIRSLGVRQLVPRRELVTFVRLLPRVVAKPPQTFMLSVAFVNRVQSAKANRQYRQKAKPADVLSFRLQQPEGAMLGRRRRSIIHGEILLCTPAIRARAKELGRSNAEEARRLFIHGLLHLFGYHHDRRRDEERMDRAQEILLHLFKSAPPV